MSDMNHEHLLNLAQRCERGAAQLTYEAEHAAEVLATRAGGDQIDPQVWAARQAAAATAAHEYAQDLRAEAAALAREPRFRPSEARIREAEMVADAANLGGILIDGRPLAEAAATEPGAHIWSPGAKEAWESGTHPTQLKAQAIEGSGMFDHVDKTINGVRQTPFWQLGHTDQAQNTPEHATATATEDDADGM